MSHFPFLFYSTKVFRSCLYYIMRKVHDNDYLFFVNCRDIMGGDFIDIGANQGQSAMSLSVVDRKRRIISFEPNLSLKPLLKITKFMLGEKFTFYLFGIGETTSEREFYIPKLNRILLTAEGSFDPLQLRSDAVKDAIGKPYEIIKYKFRTMNFDEFMQKSSIHPAFIKIDVQGFELDALKGMVKVIQKYAPIFLIEKSNQLELIRSFFNSYDYRIYYYDYRVNKLRYEDTCISSNYFSISQATINKHFKGLFI